MQNSNSAHSNPVCLTGQDKTAFPEGVSIHESEDSKDNQEIAA